MASGGRVLNPMNFKLRPSLVVGIILLTVVGVLSHCSSGETDSDQLKFLNHHDTVSYVGMNMCAQCHPDQHKTFVHTGMGSSFGEATLEKSSATFHSNPIFDSSNNLYYLPFFKDGNLYIKEYELAENGDTLFVRSEKINFIVGSGQHTNSHLMLRNGYIVQAPLTFYTQDQKWDLPPGFENGQNSRFNRIIDIECMSCHNSIPTLERGHKRKFANIGLGIDCERCHGPGELHVQFRQKIGLAKTGKFDSTIVNPARLSSEQLIDLCQRCHLQGNNVLKPGMEFTDFRPGMRLSDVFEVYLPEYKGDKSDFNMADHSQRMQMSNCYVGSKGELNCISCHNPHVSVKSTKKEIFNTQCESCHKQKTCKLPIEERKENGNSCYTCHMPMSGSKDIPHVRVHDHRIQVPGMETEEGEKELIGLYAVNNSEPDPSMLLKAYLSYYEKFDRQDLYLKKAEQILGKKEDLEASIHYFYLKQDWKGLLDAVKQSDAKKEFQSAFTYYRIAIANLRQEKYGDAEIYLRLAVQMEPDRFEFLDELGNVYLKQEKLPQAIEAFKKSIEWYPFGAKAYNNLGYCLFLSSDFAAARKNYEIALRLDHQYSPALENMARLFLELNQKAEAIRYLEKAEKYSSDKERIRKALSVIKQSNE